MGLFYFCGIYMREEEMTAADVKGVCCCWMLMFNPVFIHVNGETSIPDDIENTRKLPFKVVWNAETQWCKHKYGIDLNVTKYGIFENKGSDGWKGDVITMCCHGHMPYIDSHGNPVNGGIPQVISIYLIELSHITPWWL